MRSPPDSKVLPQKIRPLPKESVYTGRLSRACVYCGQGRKLVLFATGICGRQCFYCPLSSEKKDKDVVYANEARAKGNGNAEITREARLIGAAGTGITGGDPLAVPERTTRFIRLLKKRFGRRHHIHLYTSTPDIRIIRALARTGLDEIRFHPPPAAWKRLEKTQYFGAIAEAKALGMVCGVEVPAIPGEGAALAALAQSAEAAGADYLNLNELEFSETNAKALLARGFSVKDTVSSGVRGSRELAMKILKMHRGKMPLHYCSSSYKDGMQLRKRLLRRAKSVARPWDVVTKEGLLVKGIIACDQPSTLRSALIKTLGVPARLVNANRKRKRVEIAPWVLQEIAPQIAEPAYIVEEYPTADALEVEREALN